MLTEKELLKQSEDDYMSDDQIAFFRAVLEKQKDELVNGLEATSHHLQNQERESDENDRASLEEERWLELRIREREGKLITKIDAALRRMGNGSYGYCDDSGEEIGVERLVIRPTASLSIEAKQRRESIERGYVDD